MASFIETTAGNMGFAKLGQTQVQSASVLCSSFVQGWTSPIPPAVFCYAPCSADYNFGLFKSFGTFVSTGSADGTLFSQLRKSLFVRCKAEKIFYYQK